MQERMRSSVRTLGAALTRVPSPPCDWTSWESPSMARARTADDRETEADAVAGPAGGEPIEDVRTELPTGRRSRRPPRDGDCVAGAFDGDAHRRRFVPDGSVTSRGHVADSDVRCDGLQGGGFVSSMHSGDFGRAMAWEGRHGGGCRRKVGRRSEGRRRRCSPAPPRARSGTPSGARTELSSTS